MLKARFKRLAAQDERARRRLAEIEMSIAALNDEDLLDFADIFKESPRTPLAQSAFAEVARRGLPL